MNSRCCLHPLRHSQTRMHAPTQGGGVALSTLFSSSLGILNFDSLFRSFMSHSELEDEGQQVQGFLNLLVETGALKMFEIKSGAQTRDRTIDESIKVEDGILSRFLRECIHACVCVCMCVNVCVRVCVRAHVVYLCLRVWLCVPAPVQVPARTPSSRVCVCTCARARVEVFDVFRDMSQTLDQDQRPFTFETVKGFMQKITEKVLEKLRLQLTSLKAEALNPISIRCSQVCNPDVMRNSSIDDA